MKPGKKTRQAFHSSEVLKSSSLRAVQAIENETTFHLSLFECIDTASHYRLYNSYYNIHYNN